jgi:predicted TIM-barrel fold metal-dependent hydrolase
MKTIELPDKSWDTAKKWVQQLDQNQIQAMGVMVGPEAYDEFIETKKKHPDRFLGYANINPKDPDAALKVKQAAKDGFNGIKLYPSSWENLKVYDSECYPVYEECEKHKLLIFLHFGITIGGQADLRNGNPIDIQIPSRDFSTLNFVIAHFGAGFFRETLLLQYQADNIYMDSSGSNSWMKYMPYKLTLKDVFRKAIETGGAEKILFGTDSTFFPRGWRNNILEEQMTACKELLIEPNPVINKKDIEKIFYHNIKKLTKFKHQ